ncbi:MAG: alanine racemase [Bacteroidia bacterium]|nr:alanine racemase [Bacteroidia bacterium]MDW8235262.1 alanine racemase [Bacteroidia bacterium]
MVGLGKVWKSEEIAEIIEAELTLSAYGRSIDRLSWDTRLMRDKGGFIALRALRDGHAYVQEALDRGAALAIVEHPIHPNLPLLRVRDTWEALHRWAAAWRQQLPYPVVGIAGSLGKTWVKEWLAYLMEGESLIVRSPGSFNSQLGVPVSILSFPAQASLALVEAGISQPQEMAKLYRLILPQYGILTRTDLVLSSAFEDRQAYERELLTLLEACEWVVSLSPIPTSLRGKVYVVGKDFRWKRVTANQGYWEGPGGERIQLSLPGDSVAFWENAVLAVSAAYLLGLSPAVLEMRAATLPPLPHRLQWIQEGNGRIWLSDVSHADFSSVQTALQEFVSLPVEPKTVVLTEFAPYAPSTHRQVVDWLRQHFPPQQIHLIGDAFAGVQYGCFYKDTEHFLREASLPSQGAILLKSTRRHSLQEAFYRLSGYGPAPELYIDWEKIYRNLRRLREKLPPQTRFLVMLKAEAYGSGDLLMAAFLARQGVDYIGVAYAREALRLREMGIQTPILVFYPGRESHALYREYHLETAIGTWEALEYWAGAVPLHIEWDTGMGRMGFLPEMLPAVIQKLQAHRAEVRGFFTHLAAGESPQEPRTLTQLRRFDTIYSQFKSFYPHAVAHVLNSAGALQIAPEAVYDMVRIGIGLYGIGDGLEEATALYAPILRIQAYEAEMSLNYGFRSKVPAACEVATVAAGYGDGLLRSWGEKGRVFLRGQPCSVLPPLNMDLMLVAIPRGSARVGDKVEIWGPSRSLREFAQEAGTLPYEVLVRLSPRVRRVHSWGNAVP